MWQSLPVKSRSDGEIDEENSLFFHFPTSKPYGWLSSSGLKLFLDQEISTLLASCESSTVVLFSNGYKSTLPFEGILSLCRFPLLSRLQTNFFYPNIFKRHIDLLYKFTMHSQNAYCSACIIPKVDSPVIQLLDKIPLTPFNFNICIQTLPYI